MSRIKPQVVGKIGSLEEADATLREIGECVLELEVIDSEIDQQIASLKASAAEKGKSYRQRIDSLSERLGAYAEYNKVELFADRKSVELTFGTFGYRKSTSIHVKKTTLDLLRDLGLYQFIRIKEEPDKEAMADMSEPDLAKVDAKRVEKDSFFCEPKRDAVNQELLKKGA